MSRRPVTINLVAALTCILAGCTNTSSDRSLRTAPSSASSTVASTSSASAPRPPDPASAPRSRDVASAPRRPGPASAPRPRDLGDPAPERGGTIPAAQLTRQRRLVTGAGSPTPEAALARYARVYVNWTAADLAARQRELAAISLGQARAQALQAAASAATDTALTHSHVANHGQLIAISSATAAGAGVWLLVTREITIGRGEYQGLPPTLHVIYARLADTPGGWVVSQWSPQT